VIRAVSFFAAFLAVPAAPGLSPEGRPAYEVARTRTPPHVDGRIDDEPWKAAATLEMVRNRDGAQAPRKTEARLLYDDEFLYFAFQVEDENVWSTYEQRDAHLWKEEVVEVFLQADPGHPSYIELEVNPKGAFLDIFLLDIRKPLPYESWNSHGVQWAAAVDGTVDGQPGDRGWTCEIALPLRDAVTAKRLPPKPGDRWRMNLYRIDRKPAELFLAWSPTLADDFHAPASFGEIVFAGDRRP
jgi:hypothetical protein